MLLTTTNLVRPGGRLVRYPEGGFPPVGQAGSDGCSDPPQGQPPICVLRRGRPGPVCGGRSGGGTVGRTVLGSRLGGRRYGGPHAAGWPPARPGPCPSLGEGDRPPVAACFAFPLPPPPPPFGSKRLRRGGPPVAVDTPTSLAARSCRGPAVRPTQTKGLFVFTHHVRWLRRRMLRSRTPRRIARTPNWIALWY